MPNENDEELEMLPVGEEEEVPEAEPYDDEDDEDEVGERDPISAVLDITDDFEFEDYVELLSELAEQMKEPLEGVNDFDMCKYVSLSEKLEALTNELTS